MCYENMLKNYGAIPGNERQGFLKWNILHNSGNTPENRGQILKYLLFENGVELPEKDGTFVRRKKKCFC